MAELTLEEYEKLNPKFEITHDGKKMFFLPHLLLLFGERNQFTKKNLGL